MTALMRELERLIAQTGPISVADYMALALGHPEHGYYMTRDPLGAAGDFVTAPEVSQMFGELLGLWCVQTWRDNGAPKPFALAEIGPGRGTLMRDLLRAARQVAPDFAESAEVHLIETSPALRARQKELLGDAPVWHACVETLPALPLLALANELFDALPVRQFLRTERGWCERCVGLAPDALEPQLSFMLAPEPLPSDAIIPAPLRASAVGSLVELRPAAEALMETIAARIAKSGIAALILDYGYTERATGDSLQAVSSHKFQDPLALPGAADLTAHVDFEALGEAAQRGGAAVHGPVAQGAFLMALGIDKRAARLKRGAGPSECAEIDAALERLVHPDAMGRLFKALALTRPGAPCPAGLEP
jgi:NADH dehydrogenase [ubiquinone] 1 alpha subcomplex assembly factor 7